jgi:hypothetical protein
MTNPCCRTCSTILLFESGTRLPSTLPYQTFPLQAHYQPLSRTRSMIRLACDNNLP